MRVCADNSATQRSLRELRQSVPALTKRVSALVASGGGGGGMGGGEGEEKQTLSSALARTSAVAAAQRVLVEELLDAVRRSEHAKLRLKKRRLESGQGEEGGNGGNTISAKAKEVALSRPLDAASAERMASLLRLGAGVDACADSVERHATILAQVSSICFSLSLSLCVCVCVCVSLCASPLSIYLSIYLS